MQAPDNGKTKTALIWAYVRDERPWDSQVPSAAWYHYTFDRKGGYIYRWGIGVLIRDSY
jgi:hypothetical protein